MKRSGKGAVAAGHPGTAQAACEVLRDGGNAFDAALAAICCACLYEPVLSGLGGGGFLMASSARRGERLYDFFVDTPRYPRPVEELEFYPVTVDFGTAVQQFHIGNGAIATPGLVAGLFAVHADLGRMPMRDVVAPAVALARDGAPLNALQAYILSLVEPIYTATPSARAVYTRGADARLLAEGDALRLPQWADLLESLAHEGADLFYRGEVAGAIVEACAANGGHLRREDLEGYRVERREPLQTSFAGARLLTNPPPSSGGILIAFALRLLEALPLASCPWGSPSHLARLARVMDRTNRARVEVLVDPGVEYESLLEPAFVERYRREVAGRPAAVRGTTHVSVVDGEGNTAALTVSNGEGCGALVPGTGLMLNNMLGEEDLNPGGFHAWSPATRMTSMMAPSLVRQAARSGRGERTLVLGSGGSNRIRTAILQVLVNLLAYDLPVAEAVRRPRVHCERGFLNVEQGDAEVLGELLADWPEHKLWDTQNMFFGGVHCVTSEGGQFDGAGDPRRGGVFVVA